jgi:K+-sensing histidine kinase KdpD
VTNVFDEDDHMAIPAVLRSSTTLISASAIGPALGCALLLPFRNSIANTNAALVLVLLVVAAAATGVRTAGGAAALSSALWFDFFLTQPYQHFTITAQADVETAALLVLVGIAVTEVALWGRRQPALASRKDGYLNGVMRTASLVAAGHPEPEALIAQVADQLVEVLDIDDCRFDNDTRDIARPP